MKILTEQEADQILSNPKNITNRVDLKIPHVEVRTTNGKGKTLGAINIPQEKRLEIAKVAEIIPPKEVKEIFGVSLSTISGYSNGKVGGNENQELTKAKDERMERIKNQAIEKTLESFGCLSKEKLDKCGARDLASIAKDCASVVKNLSEDNNKTAGVQLIVYAPTQRTENYYESIKA